MQQCLLIGEILCFRFLCWVVYDILISTDSLYLSIAGDHLKGRRKRQPQPQLKQALFLFLPEWCSLICPLVQLPQLKQLLEIRGKQQQQVLRNQRAHPLPQQLQSGRLMFLTFSLYYSYHIYLINVVSCQCAVMPVLLLPLP